MKHLYPLAIATALLMLLLIFTLSCSRSSAPVVSQNSEHVASVATVSAVATGRDSVSVSSRDSLTSSGEVSESVIIRRDSAGMISSIDKILRFSSFCSRDSKFAGNVATGDTMELAYEAVDDVRSSTVVSPPSRKVTTKLIYILAACLAVMIILLLFARYTGKK